MKRNLVKRVATAMAFAGIAAAVTSCGSGNNNNNGVLPGGASLVGGGVANGSGGCVISFQGNAYIDQLNGITAQQVTILSSQPGQATGGSYTYGRIDTNNDPTAGTILELNFSPSGFGVASTISGVLSMSPGLASALGGGYGGYAGYSGCPQVSSLMLNSLAQAPAAQAAAIPGIGQQPFQWVLFGGQVLVNNIPIPY